MNEQMKALITAAGALAELIYLHYTNFVRVGFTDQQAMFLCGKMIEGILKIDGGEDDE